MVLVSYMISPLCLWPARERCLKIKTTELIACGYWVDVGSTRERVNRKPFPTHLAPESEWAKEKVRQNCYLSVSERNPFDLE